MFPFYRITYRTKTYQAWYEIAAVNADAVRRKFARTFKNFEIVSVVEVEWPAFGKFQTCVPVRI